MSHPTLHVAELQSTCFAYISLVFYLPVFTNNLEKAGSERSGEKMVSVAHFSLEYRTFK